MTPTKERLPYIPILDPSFSAWVSLVRMLHTGDRATLKSHHPPSLGGHHTGSRWEETLLWWIAVTSVSASHTWGREETLAGWHLTDLIGSVTLPSGPAALKANSISLLAEVMELLGCYSGLRKDQNSSAHNNGLSLSLVMRWDRAPAPPALEQWANEVKLHSSWGKQRKKRQTWREKNGTATKQENGQEWVWENKGEKIRKERKGTQ